jgi:hypothetical protein
MYTSSLTKIGYDIRNTHPDKAVTSQEKLKIIPFGFRDVLAGLHKLETALKKQQIICSLILHFGIN